MSYLAIARDAATRYERNELHEETPSQSDGEAAELLKARIIAAVTVDPAYFDRPEYERLMAQWEALDTKESAP